MFLLSLIVYAPALRYDFVSWDDGYHIYENKALISSPLHFAVSSFSKPAELPVTYTFWALLSVVAHPKNGEAGLNPMPFHLGNILVHAINSTLVFLLLLLLFKVPIAAFFGALLFLIHPLQVEAVAWISSAKDLLSTMFTLIALLLAIYSRNTGKSRLLFGGIATLFFVLALLSKVTAIIGIPFLLILWYFPNKQNVEKSWGWLMPLVWLFIVAPFAMITIHNQGENVSTVYPAIKPFIRFILPGTTAFFYAGKVLLPINLCIDYGKSIFNFVPTAMAFITALAFYSLLGISFLPRWRNSYLSSGYLLFVGALIPVLGFFPFIYQTYSIVSDRYAYMSIFSCSFLIAAFFSRRVERSNAAAKLVKENSHSSSNKYLKVLVNIQPVYYIYVVIVCGFGAFTLSQLGMWKNNPALYLHCLKVNPVSKVALNNLGKFYAESKNLMRAQAAFEKTLTLNPNNIDALKNLAQLFKEQKNFVQAEQMLDRVLKLRPADSMALSQYGFIAFRRKNYAVALEYLNQVLQHDPQNKDYLAVIGISYFELNKFDSAIATYKRILQNNPIDAATYNNLANALIKVGDTVAAKNCYQRAINLDSGNKVYAANLAIVAGKTMGTRISIADSLNQIAIVLAQKGDLVAAQKLFQKAAKVEPKNYRALYNYGRILRMVGSCKVALQYFEGALVLEKNTSDIYYEAALCYTAIKDFTKARECLHNALSLTPERKEYLELLKQLNL